MPALAEVLRAALAHGATRVTLQVEREDVPDDVPEDVPDDVPGAGGEAVDEDADV